MVLPKGPANGKIQVGNILLKVNGQILTDLLVLELCMDFNVNNTVELIFWRRDQEHKVDIRIEDLHNIVPHRILTHTGTHFYYLSYQQAIKYCIPVKGVYIAKGPLFYNRHILKSVNKKETPDLDSLIAVLDTITDSGFITTYYKHSSNPTAPIIRPKHLHCYPYRTPKEMKKEPQHRGP